MSRDRRMVSYGKEGARFMDGAVYSHLGEPSSKVRVGPGRGLDNAVIDIGHGRVMIVTVDPVSAIPDFGMKLSAWLSVHLIASDFTASGADPEFATFNYNFPPDMSRFQRGEYVREIGSECRRLGIAIIGGNTGTYPGAEYTVIGTGSMFGTAPATDYVTPAMAREGDIVLMTKHAAIEATGSLALSFPGFLRKKIGSLMTAQARESIRLCSTVEDARTARKVGLGPESVTSLHDVTEGGVLGALDEVAFASHHAVEVELARIPVSETAEKVCQAFGLDPLCTMGEGALLITCAPGRVKDIMRMMSRAHIQVTKIGRMRHGKGLLLTRKGGNPRRYDPLPDAYWAVYAQAIQRKID